MHNDFSEKNSLVFETRVLFPFFGGGFLEKDGVGSVAQGVDLLGFDGLFDSAVGFVDMGAVGKFTVGGIGSKVGKGEEDLFWGDVINTKAFDSGGIHAETFAFKGDELCGGSGV